MHWTSQDKIRIIVNAKAGLGSGMSHLFRNLLRQSRRQDMSLDDLLVCLTHEFAEHDFAYRIETTQFAEHATILAREAITDGCTCVIAVGGDGTINEIASVLKGTDIALGIIPFGTANLLAMEMGIPCTICEAAARIIDGQVKWCDMGDIGGHDFIVMAGVGYDADVVRRVTMKFKEKWGVLAYVIQIFTGYFKYPLNPIEVELQDGTKFTAYFSFIQNGRYYAGKYLMAPDAVMDDGVLDLVSFLRPRGMDVVRYLVGQGRAVSFVRYDQITSCILGGNHPFECDGDYAGQTPITIRVVPRAIKMVC